MFQAFPCGDNYSGDNYSEDIFFFRHLQTFFNGHSYVQMNQ